MTLPDGSAEDIETGWNGAALMLSWVNTNADIYNPYQSRIELSREEGQAVAYLVVD